MFIIDLFFDKISNGGIMQDKMQILLQQIKLNDSDYHYFESGILERIIGNKEKDCYKFLIKLDSILPVDIYEKFNIGLIKAFPTIKKVYASFEVKEINYDLIVSYYKLFLDAIIKEHPLIGILKDNNVNYNDNKLIISVANTAEERQVNNIKEELIEKLENAGFKGISLDTLIDENLSKSINEEIEGSLNINVDMIKEVSIPQPQVVEEKKPKFIPKERKPLIIDKDNEEVVAGRVIDKDEEVEIIKNIITPMTNVTIEGTIFGNDVMETKTGLRIMTLKITDYTDSIYGKMFINTEEEFTANRNG